MIYYHVKEDRQHGDTALIKGELITFAELNKSIYKHWNFNRVLDTGTVELIELSQHKTYKTHGVRFMNGYTRDNGEYKVIEYNHMSMIKRTLSNH